MLKRIPLPIGFLFIAVLITSCGSTSETSPSENSSNAQTDSQPTASIPPQASTTPCPTPSPDANRKIVITAPCDGAKVAQRHFVEGVVTDANAKVSVVIHPMEVADYWVQPNVTVREGGKWKVLCYFGEPGQQHSGKHYEVIAIANSKETLREGQLFPNWPEAESKSQVVEVVRQ